MVSENRALVSIIIPTYNNANIICRAVDSCINQTYKNIEIIVIDDGSTDNTKEVLSRYNSDERFKYIYQENQERSAARNHGLDVAKGEYIQFLDSDDEIYPEKIEKQVNFLDSNLDYFLVYCCTEYINKNKTISCPQYMGIIDDLLIRGNFIPINSPLIRKNSIRFTKGINKLEDWEYWIKVCFKNKVFLLNKVLCKVHIEDQENKNYINNMIYAEIKMYIFFKNTQVCSKSRAYLQIFKKLIQLFLVKLSSEK